MTDRFATTPFGGRSLSRAMMMAQERTARARLKSAENAENSAEKWTLLRSLTEARTAFNLSDRTISVVEALLSFHPDTMLDGTQPLIVFPSNAELSMRTRGMSAATIRRHLAVLVEIGLIIRRDSPNGKRYARRGDSGEIEHAFGFDLSPLALRAQEIEWHAAAARDFARTIQRLRSEITIHLRDIAKTIEAGFNEARPGDWSAYCEELAALSGRVARNATAEALGSRRDALRVLRAKVEKAYLNTLSEQEMSGTDSSFERHIQNSNIDHQFERAQEKGRRRNAEPENWKEAAGRAAAMEKLRRRLDEARRSRSDNGPRAAAEPPKSGTSGGTSIPLEVVLQSCPQIRDYARDGIGSWRDLMQTAALVRSVLGVSPDAWQRARDAMGDINASITVAAILERAGDIRSPGGYLRALTDRAEIGQYSVLPVLKALDGAPRSRSSQ
jgi:DNA-binding transcriptional ArsR family regulator